MEDVKLIFEAEVGPHIEKMNRIFVTKHEFEDKQMMKRIKVMPSLIGRDILNRYALFLDKRQGIVLITDERLSI